MSQKPRITVETNGDVVELLLNEAGLALMLKELAALSERNDHFHLIAPEWGEPDGPISLRPYTAGNATAGHLKVLFRPDRWDREHYPHLFAEVGTENDA